MLFLLETLQLILHFSVYNTSEIAWQRVFEETAEQGWKQIRISLEKDTLVI